MFGGFAGLDREKLDLEANVTTGCDPMGKGRGDGPRNSWPQDPDPGLTLQYLVPKQPLEDHQAPPSAVTKAVALEQCGRHVRLVELAGLLVHARAPRYFRHFAEGAVEAGAEFVAAACLGRDPGTQFERGAVSHVQGMTALERGHPVAVVILVKTDRSTFAHTDRIAHGAANERQAAIDGEPHLWKRWLKMNSPRRRAGAAFVLAMLAAEPVSADAATASAPPTRHSAKARGEPLAEPSQHRLEWNYPRFRYWEWGIALAATGYFTYSVLQEPRRVDMGWHDPLPGDDAARNLFVAEGHAGRRKANNASNMLWHITEFFPFADSIIVPLLFDDFNVDVAWQMTLLNWQGIAVMGAVNRLTHDWMGRDRPALKGCEEHGPEYSEEFCQSDAPRVTQSFVSGHAASVFFGAGATCAHHTAFPMYGHPVADIGICVLALGAASTNGALRMVADAHWMTDVVAGMLVGLGSGFGLAYGLHYATPLEKLQKSGMLLVPLVGEDRAGVQLIGVL